MKRKNPRILSENRRLGIYVKIPLFTMPHCEEGRELGQDKIRPASSGTGSPVFNACQGIAFDRLPAELSEEGLKEEAGAESFRCISPEFSFLILPYSASAKRRKRNSRP